MVDFVHTGDDHSAASPTRSGTDVRGARAARRAGRNDPPRSDVGTIILHWVTAVAFFVSILTGVRISADDPDASVSNWLAPILPQGEVWT